MRRRPLSSLPKAMALPSVWRARAFARSPAPKSVVARPPVPKPVSRVPPASKRASRKSPGDPLPRLYGGHDADFDGAVAEQGVVDAAYADLAREQAATDAALARHPDLGERLGKDRIAVRELMVHRIEEYARHCGHADLLRERVDGRVGQ